MSKEAMKLALGKIKSARDCHPNAVDTLLFEAEEILEGALAEQPARPYRLLQDNGSKYFGESWDKAEQPAQQALDKMAENARELGIQMQPAQQEPVGKKTRIGLVTSAGWDSLPVGTEFYTSPPAQRTWVGLTDEELRQVWYDDAPVEGGTYIDKLRQVEAKLRSKNEDRN